MLASLFSRSGPRLAAAAFLLCMAQAQAQRIPVPRYEEEAKTETPVPLPAFPKKENLVRFPTNWTSSEIYIDSASMGIGDDETLNYTLLVKGNGGAENYSFESIRCNSGERRVLAYGRLNGTWSPARNQGWVKIIDSQINRYYFEFYRDVFCTGKSVLTKPEMLRNLRTGGVERMPSVGD